MKRLGLVLINFNRRMGELAGGDPASLNLDSRCGRISAPISKSLLFAQELADHQAGRQTSLIISLRNHADYRCHPMSARRRPHKARFNACPERRWSKRGRRQPPSLLHITQIVPSNSRRLFCGRDSTAGSGNIPGLTPPHGGPGHRCQQLGLQPSYIRSCDTDCRHGSRKD